jgi:hypothetical protein
VAAGYCSSCAHSLPCECVPPPPVRNREIANGYLEAALFTLGVDSASGEYQPDPDKVASLAVFGSAGVCDWLAKMSTGWLGELEALDMDARRIGHHVHYAREGHGVRFDDDYRRQDLSGPERDLLRKAQEIASALGPDDALLGAIMDRYETDQ